MRSDSAGPEPAALARQLHNSKMHHLPYCFLNATISISCSNSVRSLVKSARFVGFVDFRRCPRALCPGLSWLLVVLTWLLCSAIAPCLRRYSSIAKPKLCAVYRAHICSIDVRTDTRACARALVKLLFPEPSGMRPSNQCVAANGPHMNWDAACVGQPPATKCQPKRKSFARRKCATPSSNTISSNLATINCNYSPILSR